MNLDRERGRSTVVLGRGSVRTPGWMWFWSTGPVAGAEGKFSITREAQNSNTSTPAQVTAMATQEAEAHCRTIGKKFKAIEKRETITTGKPVTELRFACE